MGIAEDHYVEKCRNGHLQLLKCRSCGALEAFVRDFCPRCGAGDPEWVDASGRGVVAAVTTAHRAPNPEYRSRVPYGICLVDLAEGVRVMGSCEPGLAVGESVEASFVERDGRHLLRFSRIKDKSNDT